jgi:hypothetical protein
MAMSGGNSGYSPGGASGGGRDVVAEVDNGIHKQEWSYSIISAMGRIQKQYAIEQGLDRKLHKDYLTDEDKFRFFWSGFTNSNSPKTFIDVFFKSVLNWEVFALILLIIFSKIIVYSKYPDWENANIAVFGISYISIIGFSIYLSLKWRYFVKGDLSSLMMQMLILGRLLFLLMTAGIISFLLITISNYFINNPKELYSYVKGIFWMFDLVGQADILGTRKDFFILANEIVIPELSTTGKEMLVAFIGFGVLPFIVLYAVKIARKLRISKEREKFEKGEL